MKLRLIMIALALVIASAALAAAAPATIASDPVAERLFRDGKQLMKDGNVVAACAAYAASERTEHNVSTAMNLADCRERLGQVATAWALYLAVVAESRGDAMLTRLAENANERAAAIEPHLSYLTIDVAPDPSQGVAVLRDHQPLETGAWNRAIPVDGGIHVVEVRVPGREPWSTSIAVEPRDDRQSIAVPRFSDRAGGAPRTTDLLPRPALDAAAPALSIDRTVADQPPGRGLLAPALVGGGVASVIAGALLWRHAEAVHRRADATCLVGACSADDATAANRIQSDARWWGRGANVAMIAGAVSVVGGGALWWWQRRGHAHPAIGVVPRIGDVNGVALVGGF
jgi:hypothetical protein